MCSRALPVTVNKGLCKLLTKPQVDFHVWFIGQFTGVALFNIA